MLLIFIALIFLVIPVNSFAMDFNGTTYHLEDSRAKVTLPINSSHINITLSEKVDNFTLVDESGRSVNISKEYNFWRGDHIYAITFEKHVKGELIYFLPSQSQKFILPIYEHSPLQVILPPGYTTGNRALGIAIPEPDSFLANDLGDILIWNNTSNISFIQVDYYRKKAPSAMAIIFSILGATGAVLLFRYWMSTKRLKEMAKDYEED